MEGTGYFDYMKDDGDFDIARAGWIGDYSDPQNFLFLYESDNLGFNYPRWANTEYDDADGQGGDDHRPARSGRRSCARPRRSS